MPNRRIPPPPPQAGVAGSLNSRLVINRDGAMLPQLSSQLSSSSTLVDSSTSSPINIPARRLHNCHNRSLGSASEFQSSPRSLENGSPSNPFDGSPDEPRRPIRKAARSSDYALSVVFSQFENLADKKMELILNMGVVGSKTSKNSCRKY